MLMLDLRSSGISVSCVLPMRQAKTIKTSENKHQILKQRHVMSTQMKSIHCLDGGGGLIITG